MSHRILDHRGKPAAYKLYEGSIQGTPFRRSQIFSTYATDTKKQVGAGDWKQLLSIGRYYYANIGAVAGAVNERATYSVGEGWTPQYLGRNKKWGDRAEEWLNTWFSICDVRGTPYDLATDLFLTSVSIDRCGDNALLLTETEDRYPMVQFIPAHRIGSRPGHKDKVESGEYAGLEICNGIIFNGQQRPVAFQILGDADDGSADRIISTRDAQLNFSPYWYDQGRGISAIASAGARDWADYRDIKDYEKIGIKTASETAVIEQNETGSADPAEGHFEQPANPSGTPWEVMEGGAIRYFRSNTGSGLKVLKSERPSSETQTFIENQIMRSAFQALGWPIELSWNPEKLGGANIRMIVEKAERAVKRQQRALARAWRRVVYYGLAKAIKHGHLPPCDDWYMWEAQLPKALTVDAGHQSKSDIEEFRIGFTNLAEIYGKKGKDWEAGIVQKVKERKFLLEECARQGVSADEIQMLTPNGNKPDDKDDTDE